MRGEVIGSVTYVKDRQIREQRAVVIFSVYLLGFSSFIWCEGKGLRRNYIRVKLSQDGIIALGHFFTSEAPLVDVGPWSWTFMALKNLFIYERPDIMFLFESLFLSS